MALTPVDRLELGDLVARYAASVDTGAAGAVADLFTTEGALVAPAPPDHLGPTITHAGRAAIAESLGQLRGFPVTGHAIVGQVFDEAGTPDTATGRVACVANHLSSRDDGRIRNLVWHLHYADGYRRLAEGWRIERREMHVDWIETREVRQWRK